MEKENGKELQKLIWLLFVFIRDCRRGQRKTQRGEGVSKKSPPEKIPARICFQKGESCCSSKGFGLGTLINSSSMGTNPRKGASEIQNFGCGEAEAGFRPAEEGIYFGDRDHAAGRTLE